MHDRIPTRLQQNYKRRLSQIDHPGNQHCHRIRMKLMLVTISPLLSTQTYGTNQEETLLLSTSVRSVCPKKDCTLTISGDQQAINGFVFDSSNGPSQKSRYLVPRVSTKNQRPEDLAYLQMKGCFSLPSQRVCEQLVRCYFQHVHPSLPIIKAAHFIDDFVNCRYQNTNLLVLWSMFLAATNVR